MRANGEGEGEDEGEDEEHRKTKAKSEQKRRDRSAKEHLRQGFGSQATAIIFGRAACDLATIPQSQNRAIIAGVVGMDFLLGERRIPC